MCKVLLMSLSDRLFGNVGHRTAHSQLNGTAQCLEAEPRPWLDLTRPGQAYQQHVYKHVFKNNQGHHFTLNLLKQQTSKQ